MYAGLHHPRLDSGIQHDRPRHQYGKTGGTQENGTEEKG
jgi:hypothetical protein